MISRLIIFVLFVTSSVQAKELGIDDILNLSKRPSDQRRIIDHTKKLSEASIGVYRSSALPKIDAEVSAIRSASPTEYLFNSNNFGGGSQGGSGDGQSGFDPATLPIQTIK